MGRLVRIPRERTLDSARAAARDTAADGTAGEPARSTSIEQDDYLLRLAKYVPAEVLAFSILINAVLDQALHNGGSAAEMAGIPVMTIAIASLILGTIMSPFYVWYVHEKGDAWVTNACVSFIAFPFWSYALGAVAFTDIRDGNLAAILLASFTVISGLIKPQPLVAARAQETVESEPEVVAQDGGPRVVRAVATGGSAATAARRLVEVTNTIPMPGP